MAGQYEILKCPFCDRGDISCLYFPSIYSERRTGRSSLGKGKAIKKSSEVWLIQSGCPNCEKSKEEVEKELKNKNII